MKNKKTIKLVTVESLQLLKKGMKFGDEIKGYVGEILEIQKDPANEITDIKYKLETGDVFTFGPHAFLSIVSDLHFDVSSENEMENKEELVGRQMIGFEFEDNEYVYFAPNMYKYIGEIGEIKKYDIDTNCYEVEFEDDFFDYPADQVEHHLVEEPKEEKTSKTFEVISFKSKITGSLAKLAPNGFYQKNIFDNSGWSYETLINDKDTVILQVRRLSDGILFAINDETNNGVIKEFQVSEDGTNIMVLVDNVWIPINLISTTVVFKDEGCNLTFKSNDKSISATVELKNSEDDVKKMNDIKDCIGNGVDVEKETIQYFDKLRLIQKSAYSDGIKESDNKINIEYDWEFLKAQMNRMAKNKHKYPKNNWKKPMDIEQLKDALFRHVLEVMDNNFEDDGDELGHLSAISLNAMMINYQLKNK